MKFKEKIKRLVFVITLASGLFYLTVSFAADVDYYLKAGRELASEGKFDEAQEQFSKVIEIDSSNIPARNNLMVIGDYRNAVINKEFILYYFRGVKCLYNTQDFKQGIVEFNKAIGINPNYAMAYQNLGYAYGSLGQHSQAEKYFTKATQITPDKTLYYNLGIAQLNSGQYLKAITFLQKAIDVAPNDAKAYKALGNAYNYMGQYQLGITYFEKAIKINPNYADAYNDIGYALNKIHQHQEAVSYLEKAIQIDPNHANAQLNLGVSYVALGQYQKAVVSYKKLLQINPNHANAYLNLGQTYSLLGQYTEARENLKKAKEIFQQAGAHVWVLKTDQELSKLPK